MSVSTKSSEHSTAWTSPLDTIQKSLQIIQEHEKISDGQLPTPYFLAKSRMSQIHLVFDIFNDAYDWKTAHLPAQNDLSVIAIYFTGQDGVDIHKLVEDVGPLQNEINKHIRELHNDNGFDRKPPYEVDYKDRDPPTYSNPRTLVKA